MTIQRVNRAPGQVRGSETNANTNSIRMIESSSDGLVTFEQLQIYCTAAVTIYTPREPVELTKARDDIDSWLDLAHKMHADGDPPVIAPRVVVQALRYAGRLS